MITRAIIFLLFLLVALALWYGHKAGRISENTLGIWDKIASICVFLLSLGLLILPPDTFVSEIGLTTRRVIAIVWYLGFVAGVAWVLSAKRRSIFKGDLLTSRFSRLVKASFVTFLLIATTPLFQALREDPPYVIPQLAIRLVNTTSIPITISRRAEFALAVPVPPITKKQIISGYIQLHRDDGFNSTSDFIQINRGFVDIHGEIIDPSAYRDYLQAGNTTLQIYIYMIDNIAFYESEVPFSWHILENSSIKIDLQKFSVK